MEAAAMRRPGHQVRSGWFLVFVLLITSSSGRQGLEASDKNVLFIRPPSSSHQNVANHLHQNYQFSGFGSGSNGGRNEMEYQLQQQNSFLPEIPNANGYSGDTISDPLNDPDLLPPSIECGYTVDGTLVENGTITSPGYPDNYPAYLNCKWKIMAAPGKKILAAFSEFDVTASANCDSDYVVVTTGDSAVGGTSTKYCGKSPPREIESIGDILEIEFHTNQGDSCRGFSLDYTIVTKVVSCGTKTADVQFEFTSPRYPAPLANMTSQCDLTVSHDCKQPVCQLRLDLLDFRLGPPSAGDCNDDQFIVRANDPLPTLCGENTGQHMYVDVRGRSETNLNILTMPIFPKPVGVHNETNSSRTIIHWLNEINPNRGWKMLITQLPCDCSVSSLAVPKAPTGCLQFLTGIKGEVKSFNYEGTISNYEPCWNGTEAACGADLHTGHLNNLDYTVCVQSEPGYCGISYRQADTQAFQMSGLRGDNVPSPVNGEDHCYDDYLYIPRGQHLDDVTGKYTEERYCGQVLGNKLTGPILSFSKPFVVRTKTDGSEPHGGVAINNRGYKLTYKQIPCSVERPNAAAFA